MSSQDNQSKVIALAGNPNCGKTTLFNRLTGGTQRIGNWPGVTVEKKEGFTKINNEAFTIVDLPGVYSLSATSEDEKAARDFLLSGEPDLVVNILDSTNLERNLYLTTQLLEMKIPVLIVLNMMDSAKKDGIQINLNEFEEQLGFPCIGISALVADDVNNVKELLASLSHQFLKNSKLIEYPNEIEDYLTKWGDSLSSISETIGADNRWISLKLLEEDQYITSKVISENILKKEDISGAIDSIEKILEDTPDVVLADYKYGFIHGLCSQTVKKSESRISATEKIDKIVMNRFLGIPIFIGAMYLTFWMSITVGGAFIDFFDIFSGTIFVDGFGELLGKIHSPQWLITLLAGGIGGGIQTVATFIPVIFFMFLMLSLLEDSGYMARAAFVMDRFLRHLGLPGKAFVPMLVGFGCTVPAIMATRTLDSKKDRFTTIFMAPFMSCGARLPVYALFGAAFFPKNAGFVVFTLYLAGITLAIVTGLLLKNTLFKGESSHFIMELPPYHKPRMTHIFIHTFTRLKEFTLRAGKVIIIVVVVLAFLNSIGTDGSFGNEDSENSLLASIGKTITPIFGPMGIKEDNWPATVGIFTGLFAKEAVVGTLNSLYSLEAAEELSDEPFDFWGGITESFATIPDALTGAFSGITDLFGFGVISNDEEFVAEEIGADTAVFALMRNYFSNTGAYAYLLFILLYFPCVAALGASVKEMGTQLGWIQAAYLTILGWAVATLYYQVVLGHQLLWIIVPLLLFASIFVVFKLMGRKNTHLRQVA